PLMYKVVWWAMGHSSQQINVSAHVSLWYLIAALLVGAQPLSAKVSRTAFLMYILFLQLPPAPHLLAVHGLAGAGAVEAAQGRNGCDRGMFEWLRRAPWGHPAFAGMFLSLIFFGFI